MIGKTFAMPDSTKNQFGAPDQPAKHAGLWAINSAWLAEFNLYNPDYSDYMKITNRQVVLQAVTSAVERILTANSTKPLQRDIAIVIHWDRYFLDIAEVAQGKPVPVYLFFVCSESQFSLEEWSEEPYLGSKTQSGGYWSMWNVSEIWGAWALKKSGGESWRSLMGSDSRDKRRKMHGLLKDRLSQIFSIPSESVGLMIDWDEFSMYINAGDTRLASMLSFMTNINHPNFGKMIYEHGNPLVEKKADDNLLPEEGPKGDADHLLTLGDKVHEELRKDPPAGTQVTLLDENLQESKLNVVDATGGPGFLG